MFRLIGLLLLALLVAACFNPSPGLLQAAEELSRQGKYEEAISTYRQHMDQRLRAAERPDWENPYFYLILIGDIQLGINKPEDALESYLEADSQKVDAYLVSDRIRSVARYYENENDLKNAVALLSEHRERDPLLFDSFLDRLSRELVMQEDASRH